MLAYERHGSGATLVLLHGVGHRRQAWYPVLDRLAGERDVILIDLPGHGESPPLDLTGTTVVGALESALLETVVGLGVEHPHFGGNSLGGYIALEAGARGLAASVTAFSPAGFWRTPAGLRYPKAVFATMNAGGRALAPFARRLVRHTPGRAVMFSSIVAHPGRIDPELALGDYYAFAAARPALKEILTAGQTFRGKIAGDVPVTIAWGARDRLLLPYQADVAREVLPEARHVRLRGCGHVPMSDDPESVARILLEGSSVDAGSRA